MTKPATLSPDPMIMAVRKAMKELEPRTLPTETMPSQSTYHNRLGWKCPYCGIYLRRDDRTVRTRYGQETKIDYSSFNMHFGAVHATPFWKEQHIIKTVKKYLT